MTTILPPTELYPQITQLAWYQSLPTLQQFEILSIASIKPLNDHGGKRSTMTRTILNVIDKSNNSNNGKTDESNQANNVQQLRLLAKIVESSAPILRSTLEVNIYQDVIQPLLPEFSDLSQITPILPDMYKASPELLSKLLSKEQFKSPYPYYGESNEETQGKFLLLGDLHQDAEQCGSYFGDIPHNKDRDLVSLTAAFPKLTEVDVSFQAFNSIAKLHAKYWNNQFNKIPTYLSSYEWYFDHSDKGKQDYEDFVSTGQVCWDNFKQQRIDAGLVISDYMSGMIDAILQKSTWDNFKAIYHVDNRKKPLSIIHCDYYPGNALISSSEKYSGLVDQQNDNGKSEKTPHFFIFDYEFTCVSTPAQDLAQWACAQIKPHLLEQYEDQLLNEYYQQLEFYYQLYYNQHQLQSQKANSSDDKVLEFKQVNFKKDIYPFDQLYNDYQQGCVKWIWLILVSCSLVDRLPVPLLQFFFDQVESFMKRHKLTVENAPILHR